MSNIEGMQFYADPSLEDIILNNVISFMKWGLLEVGAFYNVASGQKDYNGNDQSRLQPLVSDGYTANTIYKGRKHDWVWEQGITLKYSSGSQPYRPSGVLINGTFYATGTTIFGTGYYIDYSRGQCVFSNPLSNNTIVQIPHTLRAVGVYDAEDNEYRAANYAWRQPIATTGSYTNLPYQAYLPAISVKIESLQTNRGLELGSRGKVTYANLRFDIISTNKSEQRKLTDFCYFLETKSFWLYDYKNSPKPLNYRGELVTSTGTWPYLVQTYPLSMVRFAQNARMDKISNNNLPFLYSTVRISLEFDSYPI